MSKTKARPAGIRLGGAGELLPRFGFSRREIKILAPNRTAWVSHDTLRVISGLEQALLPGGDGRVGPQWLLSVSRQHGGREARCRVTDEDLARVVDAFGLPAFDEDNHHPGVARHLWCPIDPQYQNACECKLSEVTIISGEYVWTTEADSCRGCDYREMFGPPCPIHGATGP